MRVINKFIKSQYIPLIRLVIILNENKVKN
jgi:hypothetical protein